MHTGRGKKQNRPISLNPSSLVAAVMSNLIFSPINIKWTRVHHDQVFLALNNIVTVLRLFRAGRKPTLSFPGILLHFLTLSNYVPTHTLFSLPWHLWVIKPVTMHFTRQLEEIKELDCYSTVAILNHLNSLESLK